MNKSNILNKKNLKNELKLKIEWSGVHVTSEDKDQEKVKIAIVLGSMNGANNDTYSRHTVEQLYKTGFRTVFAHWKHAKLDSNSDIKGIMSFTDLSDIEELVDYVHELYPKAPVYLVGMSMGGNIWLRYAAKHKVIFF